MLRRLGLDLRRGRNVGHQRQVDVDDAIVTQFDAHLANRLEEGQRLDVAHRAPDFDEADVGIPGPFLHAVLDLIRDMWDHLHRRAEVVAAPLLRDDALVDAARGVIRVPAALCRAHEALVMAEVEVRLGPVVGDENLAVLKWAHGSRIHVDVGIQLDHADREPARLENRAKTGRGNALAKRGNHATGYEYV